MNVREFPSLLLPLEEDEEARQSPRAFYIPTLLLTQAVCEDLVRQGFKYCITTFGMHHLLEIPEKLLAGEFADKSNMKH